jgi:hypothetical protein
MFLTCLTVLFPGYKHEKRNLTTSDKYDKNIIGINNKGG